MNRSSRARIAGSIVLVLLLASCGFGVTGQAIAVDSGSAILTGAADRTEPGEITYWFEYGTTDRYGLATERQTEAVTTGIPVASLVDGLASSTTYHYRLCVVDHEDEHGSCGKDRTFTTAAPPDSVMGTAFFWSFGSEFAFTISAESDADGANPRGTVSTFSGAPQSNRSGPITCLHVVGDRAAIGWDAPSDLDDMVLFVEQIGADGRSQFAGTVVDEPPTTCPAPAPEGDLGIRSDLGGFTVIDSSGGP